jgi:hypothetical protein
MPKIQGLESVKAGMPECFEPSACESVCLYVTSLLKLDFPPFYQSEIQSIQN